MSFHMVSFQSDKRHTLLTEPNFIMRHFSIYLSRDSSNIITTDFDHAMPIINK